MSNFIDLTGKKFGTLFVTKIEEKIIGKPIRFECVCDCGKSIIVHAGHLRSGHTKSCGSCGRKTHGMSNTSIYGIWRTMIQRCENSLSVGFDNYGGRGIRVCDRWRNSFEQFLFDMGERPSKSHSIDRIDNNGDYEPNNCRWSTRFEQDRNKSNNRLITFNGKTQCLKDLAIELGCGYLKIKHRIDKYGWSVEKALTTPVTQSRSESKRRELEDKPIRRITYQGITRTVREWSESLGINRTTLDRRIINGWSVEKALTTPVR